ncbi:MAG: PorV/PorQ family protein [bacterium]
MRTKYLLFILIFGSSATLLNAQGLITDVSKSGTSVATFLEISIGAPAVGMGGAYVSIANDATALYWNVAGIAELEQNEVVALHNSWIAGTSLDFLGLVLKLGDFGSLGASIISLSMDDMVVRTVEQPDGTGEFFSAGDIAVGLSYARQLTDRFSIGFTAKFVQQTIWHETAKAFAIDAGSTFKTDLFGGMTIGANISNFGTKMKLSGRDTRHFIRIDDNKLGSNERIPTNIELDSWHLPLTLQFGVSTNIIDNEKSRWTIALDALHPSDDYESVNLGMEYAFGDLLFLRGGYQSLFLDDAEGGLSFGAGLKLNMLFSKAPIKIDYAFRDMGRLEDTHVFSIAVSF